MIHSDQIFSCSKTADGIVNLRGWCDQNISHISTSGAVQTVVKCPWLKHNGEIVYFRRQSTTYTVYTKRLSLGTTVLTNCKRCHISTSALANVLAKRAQLDQMGLWFQAKVSWNSQFNYNSLNFRTQHLFGQRPALMTLSELIRRCCQVQPARHWRRNVSCS